MNVRNIKLSTVIQVLGVLSVLTSCLPEPTNERPLMEEYMKEHGITEEHKITGTDIYLKYITEQNPNDTITAKAGETVIADYRAEHTDGSVFLSTYPEDKTELGTSNTWVYGAQRLVRGNLIQGLDTCLGLLGLPNSGEPVEAIFLFPSNYAYFDEQPVAFKFKLYEIIDSLAEYEANMFEKYIEQTGITDTFPITPINVNLRYRMLSDTILPATPTKRTVGNEVRVELIARFAEPQSNYHTDTVGPQFFPLGSQSDQVSYLFGETKYFPIIPAMDSVVANMKVNDVLEIVTTSANAFGTKGYIDEDDLVDVVPPNMPVHYQIKLIK